MLSAALETQYASFSPGIPAANSIDPSAEVMKMNFFSLPARMRGRKERMSIVLLINSSFSSSSNKVRSLRNLDLENVETSIKRRHVQFFEGGCGLEVYSSVADEDIKPLRKKL